MSLSASVIRAVFISAYFFFVLTATDSAFAQTNIALNKSVTASSSETSSLTPAMAVDGVSSSRWSSAFADNQWIAVDLGMTHEITGVKLNWQNSYAVEYELQTSVDGVNWTTVFTEKNSDGGIDSVTLNTSGRYLRMLGIKRFTRYGFSLWEFEIYGSPVTTNVALNKTATSSSNETSSLAANFAIDGSTTSRWSSSFSDNQWLNIDLGSDHQITRVKLNWQNSHGVEYQLQTSSNGNDWTTIFHERNGDGAIDDINVTGSGRYIRMLGIKRFTKYGFSLWEMEVYGYPTASSSSSSSVSSSSSSSVKSSSSSSSSSSSNSSSAAAVDTVAPSVPGSVKATAFETRIEVSWSKSTDNFGVTGYEIYRNAVKVADASSSVTTYVDNNVSAGVIYSYTVRAKDAAGNWSAQSSTVTANLVAASSGITLQWATPKARENGDYMELDEIGGFEIRYKRATDTTYTVAVIPNNYTTSITLGNLSGDYVFEIAAYDITGLYSEFIPIQPK